MTRSISVTRTPRSTTFNAVADDGHMQRLSAATTGQIGAQRLVQLNYGVTA
ncbi:MAG: hypothetical protein Q8L60_03095 [Gammaproteobacteria bacterium]|nr:hypothetical protein [Gammaproteobacteria bacterium]MDP2348743.1 hypothetical protein [Gammaproteobacteria bacterium]